MSVVNEIQENDPTRRSISIPLAQVRQETSEEDLVEALQRNPFITKFYLRHLGPDDEGWPLLLDIIASRGVLTKLFLNGGDSASAGLVIQILRAAQSNASVKCVELFNFQFVLGSELFTFLHTEFCVPKLVLDRCDMAHWFQREQGASTLAASVHTEFLKIEDCQGPFVSALLQNLRRNACVKTLCLFQDVLREVGAQRPSPLVELFETTSTLQGFEMNDGYLEMFESEEFSQISQGLIKSASVSAVKVRWTFFDDGATRDFLEIVRNKQNLSSLSLDFVSFGQNNGSDGQAVLAGISAALTRPDSHLRCLECVHREEHEDDEFPFGNDIPHLTLLRAVANSKLNRFKIGVLVSQQHLQSLMVMIPSLRIKELEFATGSQLAEETVEQNVLRAVKDNFSLRSVRGFSVPDPDAAIWRPLYAQAEDRRRLAFYFNRNECLDQWAENPGSLDRKLWATAVCLAKRAGQDTLFKSLLSTLGSDYVKPRTGNKRKHWQQISSPE